MVLVLVLVVLLVVLEGLRHKHDALHLQRFCKLLRAVHRCCGDESAELEAATEAKHHGNAWELAGEALAEVDSWVDLLQEAPPRCCVCKVISKSNKVRCNDRDDGRAAHHVCKAGVVLGAVIVKVDKQRHVSCGALFQGGGEALLHKQRCEWVPELKGMHKVLCIKLAILHQWLSLKGIFQIPLCHERGNHVLV